MEQQNQGTRKLMTTHLRSSYNFIKKSFSSLQSPYFISILSYFSFFIFLILITLKPNFPLSSLMSVPEFSFDRNYMFLLCNGILVILVKGSSSSSSTSSPLYSSYFSSPPSQPHQIRLVELTSEKKLVSEPEVQSNPDENPNFSTAEENSNEELEVSDFFDVRGQSENDYDGDVEEEEEEEGLAAEELNKRCEEFIRKMKQGISPESRADPGLPGFW